MITGKKCSIKNKNVFLKLTVLWKNLVVSTVSGILGQKLAERVYVWTGSTLLQYMSSHSNFRHKRNLHEKLLNQFLWNLVAGCSLGQERTQYIFGADPSHWVDPWI